MPIKMLEYAIFLQFVSKSLLLKCGKVLVSFCFLLPVYRVDINRGGCFAQE